MYIDSVTIKVIPESTTRATELETGSSLSYVAYQTQLEMRITS